jgi:hypothetical protein
MRDGAVVAALQLLPHAPAARSALACPQCDVKAEGSLAPELAQSRTLQTVNLQQNEFEGGLPPEYGARGAFPGLLHLVLSSNRLNGAPGQPAPQPPLQLGGASRVVCVGSWAAPEGHVLPATLGQGPATQAVSTARPPTPQHHPPCPPAGSIPDEWSDPSAFPRMTLLGLSGNRLTGALPEYWALPALLIM